MYNNMYELKDWTILDKAIVALQSKQPDIKIEFSKKIG